MVVKSPVSIRQFTSPVEATFVNSYLIETADGLVIVDGLLRLSDAKQYRRYIDHFGKPILGVLITHSHPDHHGGLPEIVHDLNIPIIATKGVSDAMIANDEATTLRVGPLLGADWPASRLFPNTLVEAGSTVELGGLNYTVTEVGPAESPMDTFWTIKELPSVVFVGDLVFDRFHSWVRNGTTTQWVAVLDRLLALWGPDKMLYPGHGGIMMGVESLTWQKQYLTVFQNNVRELLEGSPTLTDSQKRELRRRLQRFHRAETLSWFIDIGADAVAQELANA